jgi:hypothetical protein
VHRRNPRTSALSLLSACSNSQKTRSSPRPRACSHSSQLKSCGSTRANGPLKLKSLPVHLPTFDSLACALRILCKI